MTTSVPKVPHTGARAMRRAGLFVALALASAGPAWASGPPLSARKLLSLHDRAAAGDLEARLRLVEDALAVEDYRRAACWLTRAPEGHGRSEYHLASLYLLGTGVPQDTGRAYALMERSARSGDAYGALGLARMLDAGFGVPQNQAAAVIWYRRAADAGLREAILLMGRIHLEGRLAPPDGREARHFIEQLARSEDAAAPAAAFALAEMFSRGAPGGERNATLAARWYERAARAGHAGAALTLARAYADGGRNLPLSFRWASFASKSHHPDAAAVLRQLSDLAGARAARLQAAGAVAAERFARRLFHEQEEARERRMRQHVSLLRFKHARDRQLAQLRRPGPVANCPHTRL